MFHTPPFEVRRSRFTDMVQLTLGVDDELERLKAMQQPKAR